MRATLNNLSFVNVGGQGDAVCEEYIVLMIVAQTNADTIGICIKDVLLCMNLRIQGACG